MAVVFGADEGVAGDEGGVEEEEEGEVECCEDGRREEHGVERGGGICTLSDTVDESREWSMEME